MQHRHPTHAGLALLGMKTCPLVSVGVTGMLRPVHLASVSVEKWQRPFMAAEMERRTKGGAMQGPHLLELIGFFCVHQYPLTTRPADMWSGCS